MLSESYKDISSVLELYEHEEENKPEEPVQSSDKIENDQNQDYSHMKGKKVKFHCLEKTDKGFKGKFEYDGETFTGFLQCKCNKKETSKMLNMSYVNAVIISTDKTFV